MAKNPGCWANVLDDCSGPLTREHRISVAVWQTGDANANRADKLRHKVSHRVDGGPPRILTVQNLVATVLCEGHNGRSSDIDEEAGRFAAAFEDLKPTHRQRSQNPLINWNLRRHSIDGPKLERWFLKTAINNLADNGLPIGGTNAEPNRPTRELAEMIFGLRPVIPPRGLWAADTKGTMAIDGTIHIQHFTVAGSYNAGCFMLFRGYKFLVNLDDGVPTQEYIDTLPGFLGADFVQPFPGGIVPTVKFQIEVRWPKERWE